MGELTIVNEVQDKGKKAKAVSTQLGMNTTAEKNEALQLIAEQLVVDQAFLLTENAKDIQAGQKNGLTEEVLDRILLTEDRIIAMSQAIHELIELADPVGEIFESIEKENGLLIQKKRVPIGVIGMIYEARPNVTVDAATLSLKTGNAAILRGSSSATYSNQALIQSIHKALEKSAIPVEAVQLIEDTSRETAKELFNLNAYLDVLIPRGGKKLIETVIKESTVPVLETGAGNCHLFIDETADKQMAVDILLNAKLQRPSVCNAVETVLLHEKWFVKHGKEVVKLLQGNGVVIHGDSSIQAISEEIQVATEEDWYTEYLGLEVGLKVVKDVDEAIQHISQYGTGHSEAIVTNNEKHAVKFLNQVDAAAVYHNASTRFTDGFEFGYGAEIGISTQKLHARGPMGLQALTSSKFVIQGTGQVRN
ncbi:glutamate-5-semialdehyde dehydrogenase [Sporosarcina ureilytica]|uniref:Gamma-glutamyl phosphate reductase n=1 Tax=Sporosarcina ureilytica TaxID=298596 RepID=A0A1D8JEI4_9BACL|nr:glutamate-5-semialdehyde dehydrogenase [Sporosarcina ureilytica]AOV07120.1 glutamate-5-semialdehyde dehydrogenase [Sporosarcina ureilytica]